MNPMAARYLLRFDDICPTMNWTIWERIERILDEANIKPILAVIPDNQDPELRIEAEKSGFWERVRSWQAKGWTIGLHGYQHVYVNREPGILGLNANSEFSGLDRKEQGRKLDAAIAVFARERVATDLWIAPSHSFDGITLELLRDRGLRALSDGFFALPGIDDRGIFWLPQQIWRWRRMPGGVWTICMHHNPWNEAALEEFRSKVAGFTGNFTSFGAARERYHMRHLARWEWWIARVYGRALTLKQSYRQHIGQA
jgi:hypothetical protein